MRSRIQAELAKHCGALAECRRCGHAGDVVPIMPMTLSRAVVAPRIMLVGQAPGQVEAAGGKPFAGRAGKTLFRWLERAGLDEAQARRRIFIAAVTRCYPGPSPSGRGDRVPSPTEQETCGVWLDAELELIRPKLLIPVGRLAIMKFLPNLPLDRLIGRAHEVTHAGGRSLAIPLPHPSGASSWIHQGNHPQLLERALELIAAAVASVGAGSGSSERSVA
jgi:uracil-DNA glycosylase